MRAAVKRDRLTIGVLMGGRSLEREVSFNSGRTICDHLDTQCYDVLPLFQAEEGALYLLPQHFLHRGKIADFQDRLKTQAEALTWDQLRDRIDFLYIAVHGRFAEDGTLQGMLEILGIPYLGGKVLSSAMRMNKVFHKELLSSHGVSVAPGVVVKASEVKWSTQQQLVSLLNKAALSFPVVVKPSHEGSSLGVFVIHESGDLPAAVCRAGEVDQRLTQDVLIEKKMVGIEFVCVLLQHPAYHQGEWFSLPLTQVVIEEGSEFFDYEQKYMPGRAQKIVPARISKEAEEKIIATCKQVATLLNFTTIARIDGILTEQGEVVILDPNSLTGMGPSSFIFHQAAEVGMSHTDLINFLIEAELCRYGLVSVNAHNKEGIMRNVGVANRIRVGVLLGGDSNEREISLESGRNVCYKLSPDRYEVIPLFLNDEMRLYRLSQKLLIKNSTREIAAAITSDLECGWSDLPRLCDFVFVGLHGGKGENGSVQGALEMLDLPYNGSGVLASGLCMDKFKTNEVLKANHFDVPCSTLLSAHEWESMAEADCKAYLVECGRHYLYPFIIKPHDDGCSVFVEKVHTVEEAYQACEKLFEGGKSVAMIEEFIAGMELTCGVFGNEEVVALPPSYAVAKQSVLSIQEKFLPGDGQNITPAPLSKEEMEYVQQTLVRAYGVLGCKGYVRIDCFYQNSEQSPTGEPRVVILEFNTLPALTPATCLFHQAAEIGFKPMEFIDLIIKLGFENHKRLTKSAPGMVLPDEKIVNSFMSS